MSLTAAATQVTNSQLSYLDYSVSRLQSARFGRRVVLHVSYVQSLAVGLRRQHEAEPVEV